MKKNILLLLFLIPLLTKAQFNRDSIIIHNIIRLQIPQLLVQGKPEEMGNLITDTYSQINYINGVKEEDMIYGKTEAIKYFKSLIQDNFKAISFSIENLKIYNDKAIATGSYLVSYTRSDYGIQRANFIITLVRSKEYPWLLDQVIDIVF